MAVLTLFQSAIGLYVFWVTEPLLCCLLAARWSFSGCNTHSCIGEASHLTHRWYLSSKWSAAGTTASTISQFVCVCVCVCVYQTQLAPICPGMSLHLSRGPSMPCFEGLCVCMYVCMWVHNNSYIRALHGTSEHIKHPDTYLLYVYVYVLFEHTYIHSQSLPHTHRPTQISGFTSMHIDPLTVPRGWI